MPGPKKISIAIHQHKTSISLEPEFWNALRALAKTSGKKIGRYVEEIDAAREEGLTLSCALRVHVLRSLQGQLEQK